MVHFEQEGEDFASIFQSVARQKEENEEREKIKKMLDLLDELESQDKQQVVPVQPMPYQMPMYPYYYPMIPQHTAPQLQAPKQRVEFYKVITEDGDIVDTDKMSEKIVNRKKVHTIDDIPKESEWEAIFGTPPEEEPLVDVQAGRRLKDGEKFYTARLRGEPMYAQWSGISFVALLTFLVFGIALIVLFTRLNKLANSKPVVSHVQHTPLYKNRFSDTDIQRYIFEQVDKRMNEKYNLNASHFQ